MSGHARSYLEYSAKIKKKLKGEGSLTKETGFIVVKKKN